MKFKLIKLLNQAIYTDNITYYIQNGNAIIYVVCLTQRKVYFLADTKTIQRIQITDSNDNVISVMESFNYIEEILLNHAQMLSERPHY